MLRRFYDNVLALAASRYAPWWLAVISFSESSFFPIPPDALLIPMCLARPDRAWRLALICTVSSVVGGAFGYLIGYALFEVLAAAVIQFYHYEAAFERFRAMYAEYGLWVILVKGFTPIPYKIVTIASGAADFNFVVFMLASLATRGARFFLLAAALNAWGDRIRGLLDRHFGLFLGLIIVFVIGGFWLAAKAF